jgi:hypothetical protein
MLPSSGRKGGRGQKAYLLGLLFELASDLKMEAESSFRNVVVL